MLYALYNARKIIFRHLMLNLRTEMPIIKLFNATFYISVCNVEATLRYCKENMSKCIISVIAIVMLN